MGLTDNRQMAKVLTINCTSKTQYFYRQLSNKQANVSRQMSQISLNKNQSDCLKWGQVLLFINKSFNMSQKYIYVRVL